MLSAVILLLTNSLMFTLRLNGSTGSFPKPLSAAEEKQYLERYAAGDLEARNVLIEHNLRLVAHIMKKYYTQTRDQEDLISIGTIGLIKGISSYKPEKGVRLRGTCTGRVFLPGRIFCTSADHNYLSHMEHGRYLYRRRHCCSQRRLLPRPLVEPGQRTHRRHRAGRMAVPGRSTCHRRLF